MDFAQLQRDIVAVIERYGERCDIDIDEDFALLKLSEEMGEYAQAVLIHRGQSRPSKRVAAAEAKDQMARELADIVGLAIVNAHLFDIDLKQALKDKWLSNLK